jgi:diacylglycerol O-acyltransferase / wax synthase
MATKTMSTADAAWLHMDRPTTLMVVNAVLWFDEPLDIERAREIIEQRLVEQYPRFHRRVVEPALGLGNPVWEDDPAFDLDRHVHHLALPEPGDTAALQALVGDLMAAPLDRSKPLWDIYVVDGYGAGTALVSRMHHAIADGIALARLLLSLTDEQPHAGIAPDPPARNGGRGRLAAVTEPVGAGARVARAALHEGIELAEHPRAETGSLIDRAGADARALGKLLLTPADRETVLSGELGAVQRVAWSQRIPLADVKRIGRQTGCTVNDVLVAAMTGALHGYLAQRGSLVDELRVMVPFNLRPLDQPLPRELGNRFGLVYLSLPVGLDDAERRLEEIHQRMDAIKRSPEGPLSYGILGLLGRTPPPVEQRLLGLFTPKVTAVLTNVPGPRHPVYFAGTRVAGVVGWVPAGGGISTGICIFSYDEGVIVALRVNARLVPDPQSIITAFDDEVAELARVGRRVSRRRTARR